MRVIYARKPGVKVKKIVFLADFSLGFACIIKFEHF